MPLRDAVVSRQPTTLREHDDNTRASDAHATSVLNIVGSLRARRRLLAAIGVAGLLIGAAAAVLTPLTYTSHASFTAGSGRGGAGSLAGQLGLSGLSGLVGLGGTDQMYADLAVSPVILDSVASADYRIVTHGTLHETTLDSLFGGKGTAKQKRASARSALVHAIKPEVKSSGVIGVDVKTTDPGLSRQIATRLLQRLATFDLQRRQAQASEERAFDERRLADARAALRAAEDRLAAFTSQNRQYQNAPELVVERDRLERDVSFRQTIMTTIAQGYEQARTDEARDVPTISTLEPPDLPLAPDPHWGIVQSAIAGALVASLVAAAVILMLDYWRRGETVVEEEEAAPSSGRRPAIDGTSVQAAR